jgi:DNA adenine methylase
MRYVEPFVGAGSVFYGKKPSREEIINDKDKEIMNIHRGLQRFKDLAGTAVPVCRESFYQMKSMESTETKEGFLRDYILSRASYRNTRQVYNKALGRSPYDPNLTTVAIPDLKGRLDNTVILNEDALHVIRTYDSPGTLFYLDPPYEESKRTAGYTHSEFNIEELKKVLDTLRGKFILSFNLSPYTQELFKDYHQIVIKTNYHSPHRVVEELLVKNF